MKICLYTISNFGTKAIDCIDLLLNSISTNSVYDFFIISNILNIECNYKVVIDTSIDSNYIGYLKYSSCIPKEYDYYIYLDSDILCFDSLESLVSFDKDFSITKENSLVYTHEWYYYQYVNNQDSIPLQKAQALNAGSFAFSYNQFDKISTIYDYYKKYQNNDLLHNVKLEQTIYNYVLNKQSSYTLQNCYDITDKVQLFASKTVPQSDKTLYHFCGFTNEMNTKYHYMKDFYDKYKAQKSDN